MSTEKCKIMAIGTRTRKVHLGDQEIKVDPHLRFLGLKITSNASFLPWRDGFEVSMYATKGKLTAAGLGSLPIALIKALQVKVIPAILYGCEIWGA